MARVTDPETHFRIIHLEMPVDVDGFKIGESTGEVSCAGCGAVAMNVGSALLKSSAVDTNSALNTEAVQHGRSFLPLNLRRVSRYVGLRR